jgi:hypothetical protein
MRAVTAALRMEKDGLATHRINMSVAYLFLWEAWWAIPSTAVIRIMVSSWSVEKL